MKKLGLWMALLVILFCTACTGGSSLVVESALSVLGRLYVVNTTGNSACGFRVGSSGDATPSTALRGPPTTINTPFHLAVDRVRDILYISNSGNDSVLVYDSASRSSGALAPSRVLQGVATLLNAPGGIAVDSGRDLLYVGNIGTSTVNVYFAASLLSGNVAPTRQVTGLASVPFGLFLDPTPDRLFVSLPGTSSIGVWDSASTVNGPVAPDRQIAGPATLLGTPDGLAVDPAVDTLYVADQGGRVLGFANAGTANGNVATAQNLSGAATTLGSPRGVAVDSSRQVLYCADFANNALCAFSNSRTVTGNVAPGNRIAGSGTLLDNPTGLTMVPTR